MRSGALAEFLGVHPSTFTRMADRLVSFGWVERQEGPDNRREVHVRLTPAGAELVEQVMRRRREAIAEILDPLDRGQRRSILRGLETLAVAAGEPALEDLATFGGRRFRTAGRKYCPNTTSVSHHAGGLEPYDRVGTGSRPAAPASRSHEPCRSTRP